MVWIQLYGPNFAKFCVCALPRKTAYSEQKHRRSTTENIPTALAISLTGYLKSLAARNVSELTTTAYRTDLTQFFTWLADNDLTVTHPSYNTMSHIIDYLSHLASQGRSGVTRARKLAVIRE